MRVDVVGKNEYRLDFVYDDFYSESIVNINDYSFRCMTNIYNNNRVFRVYYKNTILLNMTANFYRPEEFWNEGKTIKVTTNPFTDECYFNCDFDERYCKDMYHSNTDALGRTKFNCIMQVNKFLMFRVGFDNANCTTFYTSAYKYNENKTDYDVVNISKFSYKSSALDFYNKWGEFRADSLTLELYKEMRIDLSALKKRYNYIERNGYINSTTLKQLSTRRVKRRDGGIRAWRS